MRHKICVGTRGRSPSATLDLRLHLNAPPRCGTVIGRRKRKAASLTFQSPLKATAAEPFGLGRCGINYRSFALELLVDLEVNELAVRIVGFQACVAIIACHGRRLLVEHIIVSDRKRGVIQHLLERAERSDRKSTRLNSSHLVIS